MAKKSVYQEYNQDALVHFGLEGDPKYGVSSSAEYHTVLITQDETTYQKVKDLLLTTVKKPVLSNYKRAFVLPGCPVSLDRIKAACKEHKVTITNDYEKADFIIGHDDISCKFDHGERIKTTKMLYKLWNYEAFAGTGGNIRSADAYFKKTGNSIIWDAKLDEYCSPHRVSGFVEADSLYDVWGLPGLTVNLAYLIDTGELEVVDAEDVLHQSASKIPLTEELIGEVDTWLASSDSENRALAGKILPTIEYHKNFHLVWQLAQNIYNRLYHYNRDKDVQYWLEQSCLEDYYHMSAQDMILHLEEKEKLDSNSFRYLEPIVRKEISIHNRDLYVFKVQVKPEYRKYLKV